MTTFIMCRSVLPAQSGNMKKRNELLGDFPEENIQEYQRCNNGKRDMFVMVTRREAKPTGKPL